VYYNRSLAQRAAHAISELLTQINITEVFCHSAAGNLRACSDEQCFARTQLFCKLRFCKKKHKERANNRLSCQASKTSIAAKSAVIDAHNKL
jgi:hypothetical protein